MENFFAVGGAQTTITGVGTTSGSAYRATIGVWNDIGKVILRNQMGTNTIEMIGNPQGSPTSVGHMYFYNSANTQTLDISPYSFTGYNADGTQTI